ncbi:hypothetical protein N7298_04235 [Aeromonas caviae]|uniref:hypothetical protein n=1 Tax=Aeromonas caviae TaxID=648 RepID=UPI00244C33FD|nr:hypothetical protein [Aeromonas caviae]MDH0358030.1 hypothetical protein [Aeromonas caviae]
MTEPHIDSRTLSLVTPGGLTSEVTVRALTALQLFDYQTYLADVEWPAQPLEGDAKAAHKYTLQVQRVIYELNATMAAYGLHYLNPADTLDEARLRVMSSYPLPDHIMRLALAVKALSGLATPAPSAGESQEDDGESKEPVDPKKA